MRTFQWGLTVLIGFSLLVAGCGDSTNQQGAPIDRDLFNAGKADLGSSAKVLKDVELDSTTEGKFEAGVRAYGYEFEAKKGAALTATLETSGEDGESLDTYMVLYGPAEDGSIGPRIKQKNDGNSINFEVKENGKYLLAFTTFSNVKNADYTFSLKCDGTDFQCSRPNWDKPCEENTKYIRGGQDITEDTTWKSCKVVMLETVEVKQGATLTIRPGVEVKGNFVGDGEFFGDVSLKAKGGSIQASGTEDAPIAFLARDEKKGWNGIRLENSKGNVFQNVVVEKARKAFSVKGESAVQVSDARLVNHPKGYDNVELYDSSFRTQGIEVTEGAKATFERAVVKGFRYGIRVEQQEDLVVRDSIIRENNWGLKLDMGAEKDGCGGSTDAEPKDPTLVHTDIVENDKVGIWITGNLALLKIEKSNILKNGDDAIQVESDRLGEGSYIRNSNIFGNQSEDDSEDHQVESWHEGNALTLTDNYWKDTSDPELSENWDLRCAGSDGINVEGFMPEPIEDAGPRPEKCKKSVYEQSYWKQQSSE